MKPLNLKIELRVKTQRENRKAGTGCLTNQMALANNAKQHAASVQEGRLQCRTLTFMSMNSLNQTETAVILKAVPLSPTLLIMCHV